MKKWYYSIHIPTGGVSLFETAEYGGRGGFDSKEEAIETATKDLLDMQRLTTESLVKASKNVSYYAEELNKINLGLLKLSSK